jgi:hypothetical protein
MLAQSFCKGFDDDRFTRLCVGCPVGDAKNPFTQLGIYRDVGLFQPSSS